MTKLFLAATGLLCAMAAGFGQVRSPLATRFTAVGAYSKHWTDAASFSANQAALPNLTSAGISVYHERKFMLSGLNNYHVTAAFPFAKSGIGVDLYSFGNKHFKTMQAGIAYGKKLGDQVSIGLQINYNMISIAGYGSSGTPCFELGTLWHATEKLHLGFHVYNPTGGRFGKNKAEKLSSIYTTGVGFEASDQVFMTMIIIKEEDKPVMLVTALQYNPDEQLMFRAGVTTSVAEYFIGIGYKWNGLQTSIAINWHPLLGITPALLLQFNFKSKKTE